MLFRSEEFLQSTRKPPTKGRRLTVTLTDIQESEKFRDEVAEEDRGGYTDITRKNFSKVSLVIKALMPQPGWRAAVFADSNERLDEYLQAPRWKRTDPFFMPIPRRDKWPEEKPVIEEDNWPIIPKMKSGMSQVQMISAMDDFVRRYKASADPIVKDCAAYCKTIAFLIQLDCYWDRGLPPIIVNLNTVLRMDEQHLMVARLYYRVAFLPSKYVVMVETWYTRKFIQGMKEYLGPITTQPRLRFNVFEAIGKEVATIKREGRKRSEQEEKDALRGAGLQ